MIPLRDENPTRTPSRIVPILIVLNVGVFLFWQPSIGATAIEQATFTVCRAAIPYEITHRQNLAEAAADGAIAGDTVPVRIETARCPNKSVLASLFTSMFLHGGLLHIAGNMLYLFIFGNNVEDALGRIRFVLFYLACGIAATLAQSFASPSSGVPMVGASGAIAGVLGAYLLMFPRARVRTLIIFFFITIVELPAVLVLGAWFVMQLFQGVGSVAAESNVAYMAHIGGFVAGMVLLALFRPRRAGSGVRTLRHP